MDDRALSEQEVAALKLVGDLLDEFQVSYAFLSVWDQAEGCGLGGNVELNYGDLALYMANPTAFLAGKHGVTVEHYKSYLEAASGGSWPCEFKTKKGEACRGAAMFHPSIKDYTPERTTIACLTHYHKNRS